MYIQSGVLYILALAQVGQKRYQTERTSEGHGTQKLFLISLHLIPLHSILGCISRGSAVHTCIGARRAKEIPNRANTGKRDNNPNVHYLIKSLVSRGDLLLIVTHEVG